jgi:hypothetical protein
MGKNLPFDRPAKRKNKGRGAYHYDVVSCRLIVSSRVWASPRMKKGAPTSDWANQGRNENDAACRH